MSKEYLNNLSIEEIKFRLSKGEKIFNETDETTYAKYVDGLGICKFQRKTNRLVTVNLTLTLFYHLYFEKDDYKDMIGCVGWFWDDSEDCKVIGVLTGYDEKRDLDYFLRNDGGYYCHFVPAKKSELKFWEEEEGQAPYNYMIENIELKERLKKTQELELEIRKENAKLKELLKEYQESGETK